MTENAGPQAESRVGATGLDANPVRLWHRLAHLTPTVYVAVAVLTLINAALFDGFTEAAFGTLFSFTGVVFMFLTLLHLAMTPSVCALCRVLDPVGSLAYLLAVLLSVTNAILFLGKDILGLPEALHVPAEVAFYASFGLAYQLALRINASLETDRG